MTNLGLFAALPSLVIMQLGARTGLPGPQHGPVNITGQSETFWKPPLAHCLHAPVDVCLKIIVQPVYL